MCACTRRYPQRSEGYRDLWSENDRQVWPIQLGCLCHLQDLQGLTIMFLALGEYFNLFHCCITSQDLVCVLIILCEALPFILFPIPAFKAGVITAPPNLWSLVLTLFSRSFSRGLFPFLWSTMLGGIPFAIPVFPNRQKCDWMLSCLDVWCGAKLFNFPEFRFHNSIASFCISEHQIRKLLGLSI